MNVLKKYLLLLFILLSSMSGAQEINVLLPKDAGRNYSLVLYRGLETDTIQTGILNAEGRTLLKIPSLYKHYNGIALLSVEGKTSLRMVLDGNSFSVRQDDNDEYHYIGTKENVYLNDFFTNKPPAKKDTTLFANNFIEDFFFVSHLKHIVIDGGGTLSDKANLRLFAIDKLDLDKLYTTGLWYYAIDGIVRLSPGQELMGEDMVRILKRIKKQEVFEHFLENLITITEQYGWDDAFEIIVSYAKKSARIQTPQGDIYTAFQSVKVCKGMVVPEIDGLQKPLVDEVCLLLFYQPDCHNCEAQLNELIEIYPYVKAKDIRVITISSDFEMASVKKDKERFPWGDTLCDFNGFAGKNFVNFGVMGTPTFFLLDKDHRLVKKFALVSELKMALNL